MKKTLIIAVLALALNAGLPFTPLASAAEGILEENLQSSLEMLENSGKISVQEDEILPMLRFNRIEANKNQIGFIFNLGGSENYQLTRLVLASYRYDDYTQAMVEQQLEQMKGEARPSWAEFWSDNHFEVNPGIYLDEGFGLKDPENLGRNLLTNRPGVIYYAAEYQNGGTAEWLFGKLNYRHCAFVDNSSEEIVGAYCMVFPNDDDSRWIYKRSGGILGEVNTWAEELSQRLLARLEKLEQEVAALPSEATSVEQEDFYQELLQIRALTADTTAEQSEQILLRSRSTYNLIFGKYEEGYGPSIITPEAPQPPEETPTPPIETPEETPKDDSDDKTEEKPKDDTENQPEDSKPEKRPVLDKNPVKHPSSTNGGNTDDVSDNSGNLDNQISWVQNPSQNKSEVVSPIDQKSNHNQSTDAEAANQDTAEKDNSAKDVQIPVLSDTQAINVSKKTWWWPFWLILASSIGILAWLATRIYKRRRKF